MVATPVDPMNGDCKAVFCVTRWRHRSDVNAMSRLSKTELCIIFPTHGSANSCFVHAFIIDAKPKDAIINYAVYFYFTFLSLI